MFKPIQGLTLGVSQHDKMIGGGHNDGAFMTANLQAHSGRTAHAVGNACVGEAASGRLLQQPDAGRELIHDSN